MTDLWPQLEALLDQTDFPMDYVGQEWGVIRKPDASFHFCMAFPDDYWRGQSNQAVRILVNVVNALDDVSAERAYLPKPAFADLMRANGLELFSLESHAPVREFDVVGVTLPHDLIGTSVVEFLDLSGIALHAEDRAEDDPIVIGGGSCVYNPEPYVLFFDAFSIGEGEESIPELVSLIRKLRSQGASRREILHAMTQVPGTYVPTYYREIAAGETSPVGACVVPTDPTVPAQVTRRVFRGFSDSAAWEPCVVPFSDMAMNELSVEILRGCARGCRFCQAGMIYRPVRERSADNVVESAETGLSHTGFGKIGLYSLSSTDHSQIIEILRRLDGWLTENAVRVGLPSLRVDSFGDEIANAAAGMSRGVVTFAPEAGSQRLRDVINKNVTEADVMEAVDSALRAGWHKVKLYFMIGLPTETDEDVLGIAELAEKVLEHARDNALPEVCDDVTVTVKCSVFIPKPDTPFQWCEQISPEEARRRTSLIVDALEGTDILTNVHSSIGNWIEAYMSRGDRSCGPVVEAAWRRGVRFDDSERCFDHEAWGLTLRELGIDEGAMRKQSDLDVDGLLPWNHISSGVDREFLLSEYRKALKGQTTPDCTLDSCNGCGVCQNLGIDNVIQGIRHG